VKDIKSTDEQTAISAKMKVLCAAIDLKHVHYHIDMGLQFTYKDRE